MRQSCDRSRPNASNHLALVCAGHLILARSASRIGRYQYGITQPLIRRSLIRRCGHKIMGDSLSTRIVCISTLAKSRSNLELRVSLSLYITVVFQALALKSACFANRVTAPTRSARQKSWIVLTPYYCSVHNNVYPFTTALQRTARRGNTKDTT